MAKMRWPKWLWVLAVVLVLLGLLCLPTSFWTWVLDKSDKLRNLFLIVAGVVGAVFIYWRTSIAKTEAETRKIDAETRKQDSQTNKDNSINNMYTIAIEQLGKEHGEGRPNLEVRVGALYSLEKLAQANADYRQSIMDVLCSYVRNNAPLPKDRENPEESEYASQYTDKPRTDIQTALTIIGRSNTEVADKVLPIDLSNCYLVGADLQKADLQKANLMQANLQWATLWKANLQGAELQGANLKGVTLQGVTLQGAKLQRAELLGVNLQGVTLQGAELLGVNLQGVTLQGANLQGANLLGANLREANLQGACLRGANLQGAKLQGANLQGAHLREANLQGAHLREANLQDADLQDADLRACRNLTCEQLQSARNWQQAKHNLDCGADIPDPSEKDKKEAEQKGNNA